MPANLADISNVPESTMWAVVIGLLVVGILVFALLMSIIEAWRKVQQTKAREETKREVAAYVAEGSMTAEDGARLMAAGESVKSKLFGSDAFPKVAKVAGFKVEPSCGKEEGGVRVVGVKVSRVQS